MLTQVSAWLTRNSRAPVAFHTKSPSDYHLSSLTALYKTNPVVYKCVSNIAAAVASINFIAYNQQGDVHAGMQQLISSPNADQCQTGFLEKLMTVYLLHGNVFVYKTGFPQYPSLYVITPDEIEVVEKNGKIDHYIYTKNGEHIQINKDPLTGKCDLLHIKNSSLSEDVSPYSVVSQAAELYNKIVTHNLKMLTQGGRQSGIINIVSNGNRTNEHVYQEVTKLRDWLNKGGLGTYVMPGPQYEYKELGLKPSEMDFMKQKEFAAREIAQVFGVPYILLNQNEATYSNYKEARKHFWEETVIPVAKRLCNEFNAWVFRSQGVSLTFDTHTIQALNIENDIQTINERRRACGYPPLEGGDVLA